jgi:hypothetical protein
LVRLEELTGILRHLDGVPDPAVQKDRVKVRRLERDNRANVPAVVRMGKLGLASFQRLAHLLIGCCAASETESCPVSGEL